jgi:tetratricopeptide (TPR) repeat protein
MAGPLDDPRSRETRSTPPISMENGCSRIQISGGAHMNARHVAALVVACGLVVAIPHAAPRAQSSELGVIAFPTSGSAAAQAPFIRGVLLLHSFEYDDAKDAFVDAQRLDPGFAMAYWGEALTYTHPVWFQQDRNAALQALGRLAPTPEARIAKAPTPREQDYLRAVEILYGEGDKNTRDVRYADAMRQLHERYPSDDEAATLYAVALLGTSHEGRDIPTYMRAAAIAQDVFSRNPRHPGAAHYLIHAFDDPAHAPLGLPAARAYSRIAPAAAHALHMPAHIFFAMGMWQEAIDSNIASAAASDARIARRKLGLDERGYHALVWEEYALLQQGREAPARALLDRMVEDAKAAGSARTRSSLAMMRAVWIVDAADRTRLPVVDTSGLGRQAVAVDLFATGWAALASGRGADADAALAALRKLAPAPAAAGDHYGMPMGAPAAAPAPTDADPARMMGDELEAAILVNRGQAAEAWPLLERAGRAEDGTSFEFGPPVPVKPVHELYGELLLSAGRKADAAKQFTLALARAPKRRLSLEGLEKARR